MSLIYDPILRRMRQAGLPLKTLGDNGEQTIDRSVSDKFVIPEPTGTITLSDSNFTDMKEAIVDINNGRSNISFPASWEWKGDIPTLKSSGVDRIKLSHYLFGVTPKIMAELLFSYLYILPWNDIDTAIYANKSFGVQEGYPEGIFIPTDGADIFVVGYNDVVYQNPILTPWNIATATQVGSKSFDTSAQTNYIKDIFVSPDKTKFYLLDDTKTVFQYTMATPGDISTAVYDDVSFDVGAQDGGLKGMCFKLDDGSNFYIAGNNSNSVYQYNL